MIKIVTLVLAIHTGVGLYAQSTMRISVEVPVAVGLSYEGFLSKRISATGHVGVLTQPNSDIIIEVLDQLGTDAETVELISETFKFGWVGELGVNYNFRKNYVGLFTQGIWLKAADTPTAIVESYFNVDVSTYPVKRGMTGAADVTVLLQSRLWQAGLLYGRRFGKAEKKISWGMEAAFSVNVASRSSISSEMYTLESLSAEVDQELDYYYSNYALVPSVCVYMAYKLN